ncbi:hypothetical protein D3C85_1783610 [compost metagenome]
MPAFIQCDTFHVFKSLFHLLKMILNLYIFLLGFIIDRDIHNLFLFVFHRLPILAHLDQCGLKHREYRKNEA